MTVWERVCFVFLPPQTISFVVLEAIGRLMASHHIIKNNDKQRLNKFVKIISLIKQQNLNDNFLITEIIINNLA